MGIPTGGPQQGGNNPAGGGVPTGRTPENRQPAQPQRQRPAGGIPQPQQPSPQRPARSEDQLPGGAPQRRPAPQRPSSGLPSQGGSAPQRAQHRPQSAPQPQRPVGRPQPEALPVVPDEQFDDSFSFGGQDDDLFSDVPKSVYEDIDSDESLGFDDDIFETVTDDSADEDDFEAEPAPAPRRAPVAEAPRAPAAKPRRLQGTNRAPERSKAASEEYSEEFVDKEELKLKPFGKPKKKAKVGDFDPRKNLEGQRKLYRGLFIGAIVAIVGFGAYQTFWPQENLSAAEVENIAALTVGETGFPTTKGEGFAQSFMESLLTVDSGPENIAKRTAALSYFYGTTGDARAFDSALTTVGNISQQVVYGPVVLDSTPISSNAAAYEIGVLLSTTDSAIPVATGTAGNEAVAESMRWVSFNVNVYYDAEKDSFAVAPNSPSLIPAPSVEAPSVVPKGEPLGDGLDDYPESVNATVVGFLSGYRESTKDSFDKILQYIGTDADESLRDGLGSRYQFATPDNPSNSIDIEVFQPGEDASELKVALTVDWQIPTSENSSVTFPSHYVLTLQSKGGSSDYTVTKFAPYYWVEAADNAE